MLPGLNHNIPRSNKCHIVPEINFVKCVVYKYAKVQRYVLTKPSNRCTSIFSDVFFLRLFSISGSLFTDRQRFVTICAEMMTPYYMG